MARPNPRQDGPSFLESIAAYLLLAGNAYVEAVSLAGDNARESGQYSGQVRELYALRPDRMKVVPGPDGWPQAFDYTVNGASVRFDQGGATQPPILHLTLFNPLDDYYGLSPLEAAACAVDTHNAAARWNKALLDNAARPSGALVYGGPEGGTLSHEQFDRLKRELEREYQGAANAGRPLVLEGGLDWKAMSLTPKDMDFMEAKHAAAREIALAFAALARLDVLLDSRGFSNGSSRWQPGKSFRRPTRSTMTNRAGAGLRGSPTSIRSRRSSAGGAPTIEVSSTPIRITCSITLTMLGSYHRAGGVAGLSMPGTTGSSTLVNGLDGGPVTALRVRRSSRCGRERFLLQVGGAKVELGPAVPLVERDGPLHALDPPDPVEVALEHRLDVVDEPDAGVHHPEVGAGDVGDLRAGPEHQAAEDRPLLRDQGARRTSGPGRSRRTWPGRRPASSDAIQDIDDSSRPR